LFEGLRKRVEDWMLPKGGAISVPDESHGRDLIFGAPRRLHALVEIKNLQIGIPQEERSALVDPVLVRFAHFVVDLPASEHNHDSSAYGLLDHSLGVALATIRELVRPSFRPSEDPTVNHREQPIWAYAGFLLGLIHDVGKVLDLEVVPSDGSPAWNPLSEPLSTFLKRHGRRSSGPKLWRWKKDRRIDGHVEKTGSVAPQVIPPRSRRFLGGRLDVLLEAFQASYKTGKEVWRTGPAGRVVAAVRRADQALSEAASPPKERKKLDAEATVASTPPEVEPTVANAALPHAESGGPSHMAGSEVRLKSALTPQSAHDPHPSHAQKVLDPMKRVPQLRQISERDERIETEIKPENLLELIRSLLRSGNISRNSRRAELFVRQDHVWLRYPEALRTLLSGMNITWSSKLGERLEYMLRKMPFIAPENPKSALVSAFPEPRDKDATLFVRLTTQGLLPEKELADLGYWPYEMRVQPTAIPNEKGLPFRAIPGGRA
jgi:hypothetical protein